ncbi:MAG: fibronectin type III domain-containing protein [Akkermansiaceae bacterium]|nr:fibronectin type III domain-containing protein [Akkermansiaceae bacterium]
MLTCVAVLTGIAPAETPKSTPQTFPFAVRPAVRFLGPSSAEVFWESSEAGRGLVAFGSTGKLGQTAESDSEGTRHRVVLNNLLPATLYHYRIAVRTPGGLVSGKIQTFDTSVNEIPPDLSSSIPPATNPLIREAAARAVNNRNRGFCLIITRRTHTCHRQPHQ